MDMAELMLVGPPVALTQSGLASHVEKWDQKRPTEFHLSHRVALTFGERREPTRPLAPGSPGFRSSIKTPGRRWRSSAPPQFLGNHSRWPKSRSVIFRQNSPVDKCMVVSFIKLGSAPYCVHRHAEVGANANSSRHRRLQKALASHSTLCRAPIDCRDVTRLSEEWQQCLYKL